MSNNEYVEVREYNLYDVASYLNTKPEFQEIDLLDFQELLDDMLEHYRGARIVLRSIQEDRSNELSSTWELINNEYSKYLILISHFAGIIYEIGKDGDRGWIGIHAYLDSLAVKSSHNLSEIRELIHTKIKK